MSDNYGGERISARTLGVAVIAAVVCAGGAVTPSLAGARGSAPRGDRLLDTGVFAGTSILSPAHAGAGKRRRTALERRRGLPHGGAMGGGRGLHQKSMSSRLHRESMSSRLHREGMSSRLHRRARRGGRPDAAGGPSVEATFITPVSPSEAVLEAEVALAGATGTYLIRYSPSSSGWCLSDASFLHPASETAPQPLPEAEEDGDAFIEETLTGLTPGSGYCAQLVLETSAGTVEGEKVSFTSGAPSAIAVEAFAEAPDEETVEGFVETAGQPTGYHVEYALSEAIWCKTEGRQGKALSSETGELPASEEALEVSVELTELTAGNSYCAELVAENASAGGSSSPLTFTAGAPTAVALEAFSTAPDAAVLAGLIDTAGQDTTYEVMYAPATSSWCGGSGGDPETTTPQMIQGEGGEFEEVEVAITGLEGGVEYCAELLASNDSGQAQTGALARIEFVAGLPSVFTFEASSTSARGAVLEGEIDPAGQETTYEVAYALEGSQWCDSEGTEGSPENNGGRVVLASTGGTFEEIQAAITGLEPETEYCGEIVARNATGTAESAGTVEFQTTALSPPTASTAPVKSPTQTTAVLEGEVNPAEQDTTYEGAYALKGSQWCTTGATAGSPEHTSGAVALAATDDSSHPVTVELTGLAAGSEYCAEILARNATGPAPVTAPVSFTTEVASNQQKGTSSPKAPPSVSTGPILKTETTRALIEGQLDPSGQKTTYELGYGLESSQWCTSEGREGTPEHTTATATLPAEDSSEHAVQIELAGLAAGSEYCAGIIAHNSAGTSAASPPAKFKTASGTPPPNEPGSEGKPVLDEDAGVSDITGTVEVRRKGAASFLPLTKTGTVPIGSEIEATNGRLAITVALPDGKTQTAEVFGGRFRLEQQRNGTTHFVLTLRLTGCPRVNLPRGSAALVKHTQPFTRHLWVSEKKGKWDTNGRFVSTSVEGTTWLTLDKCGRSIVVVKAGKVKVVNLVTHKTKVLRGGQSYTAKAKPKGRRRR